MKTITIEYKREVTFCTTVEVKDEIADRLLNLPDDEGNVEMDRKYAEVEEWCDEVLYADSEIKEISITELEDED